MTQALLDVFHAQRTAPVLLASAAPGMFCAGADLTVPDAERAEVSDLLYQCYEVMITRPGPVIAVVDGPAVGRRRPAGRGQRPADRRTAGPVPLGRAARPRAWPWGPGCCPA